MSPRKSSRLGAASLRAVSIEVDAPSEDRNQGAAEVATLGGDCVFDPGRHLGKSVRSKSRMSFDSEGQSDNRESPRTVGPAEGRPARYAILPPAAPLDGPGSSRWRRFRHADRVAFGAALPHHF
jgi:hypothetical protein